MFKFLKKQKKDEQKDDQKKGDDCPMCKVSPEVVDQLKKDKNKEGKHHGCCG